MSHITNRLAVEEALDDSVGRRPNGRRIARRLERAADRVQRPARADSDKSQRHTTEKEENHATR